MENKHSSRRKFIQQTALASGALLVANPLQLFSNETDIKAMSKNIKSRGYAGKNTTDPLEQWNFERRPVGDDDILIDIKFWAFAIQTFIPLKDIGGHRNIHLFRDTKLQE